jgi:hypothetical protein
MRGPKAFNRAWLLGRLRLSIYVVLQPDGV